MRNHCSCRRLLSTLLLLTFAGAIALWAQPEMGRVYLEITKVKQLSDDMMSVEEELVTPFVQERIREGNQIFHALYEVRYPASDEAEYDYIVINGFADFAHLEMDETNAGRLAMQTFPNARIPEMIERYRNAMSHQGTEIFVVRDEAFPGMTTATGEHSAYAVVNHMKVRDGQVADYLNMEIDVWKPLHQSRARAGLINDWMLLERVLPYGKEMYEDYLTVDMFSKWTQLAGSQWGEHFQKVHPNRNWEKVQEETAALRDLRHSEVWRLVHMVDEPAESVSYQIMKPGKGPHPMNGQEVAYRVLLNSADGEELFSSEELGFSLYEVIGDNLYDRYMDEGFRQLRKGGLLQIELPAGSQSGSLRNMTDGKTATLKVELLDIGIPAPDGVKWLEKQLAEHGLEPAMEQYSKLRSHNPRGYVFREGDMNQLGYRLLEKRDHSAALYVFALNQQNYPASWNAWDSLADGYMAAGDHEKAMMGYEKALKINPEFGPAREKLDAMKAGLASN